MIALAELIGGYLVVAPLVFALDWLAGWPLARAFGYEEPER